MNEDMMRVIDLRGTRLNRAQMLEAIPRAEMGTNEASDLVRAILDDAKIYRAAALCDYEEQFDHIVPMIFACQPRRCVKRSLN